MTGCLYLGSQDILVIHKLLEKIMKEEDRLTEIKKQKKAEEEKKQGDTSPSTPTNTSTDMFGLLTPQKSPKPEENEAKAKEGIGRSPR